MVATLTRVERRDSHWLRMERHSTKELKEDEKLAAICRHDSDRMRFATFRSESKPTHHTAANRRYTQVYA